MGNHSRFLVTFDDGVQIPAEGDEWWTLTLGNGHGSFENQFLQTVDIPTVLRNSDVSYRLWVVESEAVELPIDPYVLGYWLGDGYSANGGITVSTIDFPHLMQQLKPTLRPYEVINTAEYKYNGDVVCVNVRRNPDLCPKGHWKRINPYIDRFGYLICRECTAARNRGEKLPTLPSLHERLKGLQLLKNKHLPQLYLDSGTDQRRAVLQGLMDSDGHITKEGRAHFTNTSEAIIVGFVRLARSLGYKPQVRKHGTSGWIVGFTINSQAPVVRLPRKAQRVIVRTGRLSTMRYVKSVEVLRVDE